MLDLLELSRQPIAELDRVDPFALEDRDAQDDRLPAVVIDGLVRRVDIAARHLGEVAQRGDPIGAWDRDDDVFDFRDVVEIARRFDDDVLTLHVDQAARQYHVLPLQRVNHHTRAYAEFRELGVGQLQEDSLILHAIKLDASDAL